MKLASEASRVAPARMRGFSVIELVVVLLTLAIIIPLAIRFTTNTVDLTDDQLTRARVMSMVEDSILQVDRDLGAARSCRTSLLDPPIISISEDTLEFVADIDGDGQGDYVRYELAEDLENPGPVQFRRITSTTPDGTATDDERCTWTGGRQVEILAILPTGVEGRFAAYHPVDGEVTERTCRGLISNFDQCKFTSVVVEFGMQSLAPDSPDFTITREILIDQRWGRT